MPFELKEDILGIVSSKSEIDGKDVVRKIINFEIKGVTESEDERSFEAIASTEAEDRDRDIIRVSGWQLKNYKKNPVLLWAHGSSNPPIGKGSDLKKNKDDGTLTFRPTFPPKGVNPLADVVYEMGKFIGSMAFSVGFDPIKYDKRADLTDEEFWSCWGGYEFTKQELLEISACPVPANQEAIGHVKSLGLDPSLILPKEKKLPPKKEKADKPEETEDFILIQAKTSDAFEEDSFQTIDVSSEEGIKAVIGKAKDTGKLLIQKYLFGKDFEDADEWVREHHKTMQDYLPTFFESAEKVDGDISIKKDPSPDNGKEKSGDVLVVDDPSSNDPEEDVLAGIELTDKDLKLTPSEIKRAFMGALKSTVKETVKSAIRYELGILED